MKKEYRTPEMEIVTFETEDIIRTSNEENDNPILGDETDWDNMGS